MRNKVYKVVHIEGRGRKVSAFCNDRNSKAKTRYPMRKEVVAKVGKLFAFSNLADAAHFMRITARPHPTEVWEAKATGVSRPKFSFFIANKGTIEEDNFLELFWSGEFGKARRVLRPYQIYPFDKPPPGTVICSSIRLIRKVA